MLVLLNQERLDREMFTLLRGWVSKYFDVPPEDVTVHWEMVKGKKIPTFALGPKHAEEFTKQASKFKSAYQHFVREFHTRFEGLRQRRSDGE